jgi:hypothetical protein
MMKQSRAYQITARKPQDVKNAVLKDAGFYVSGVERFHRGAITGWLNRYLNGDENRVLVLRWLFGKHIQSSKDLSISQWFGLHCWIDPHKGETEQWETGPLFPVEASLVLTEAIRWKISEGSEEESAVEHMVAIGYEITAIDSGSLATMVKTKKSTILKNIF